MPELKPMVYEPIRSASVLGEGCYCGFNWLILSYGTHPCGYVEIPPTHFLFGHSLAGWFDPQYVDCHGGITYSAHGVYNRPSGWWIGWDYHHYRDYSGYALRDADFSHICALDKKWSTAEIFVEVVNVIDRLIELEATDKRRRTKLTKKGSAMLARRRAMR